MPYEFIRYEKIDRVARIVINRPEVLNALHPPGSAEMLDAFTDFRDDPELLVAIVTGEGGRAFCAGNDLKYQAEHGKIGERYVGSDTIPFAGITSEFTCWKPIIAAVNGYAMGGGLELVLACDLVIASENAQFGAPEGLVGLVAGAGGAHRLPRQLPLKVAMYMLLTSKRLTAHEAHGWGLINEVVPQKNVIPVAERMAQDILKCAPLSVRAHKQMVLNGLGMHLDKAMDLDYSEFEKAMRSADYVEGPTAFAQKRLPVWEGG